MGGMDSLIDLLPAWHSGDFAELAWTAFALLSLFVFVWGRIEPRLHAYVLTTPGEDDDKALERLNSLVRVVSGLVDAVSFLVPRALTRGKVQGIPPAAPLPEEASIPAAVTVREKAPSPPKPATKRKAKPTAKRQTRKKNEE